MKDVSGDGGVLKEVIRTGTGERVPYDSTVIVKYSGYLEHADKPFDTNCTRRYPRLMKIGEDITLAGMEIGLLTMQRGELSRFLFSPNYAYGTLGCPPLIPPSSTVLFEMELLDFLDTAECDNFCNLTLEQQSRFPLDKALRIANTEREFGNYLFKRNRLYDAKDRYKRASSVLSRKTSCDEELRQLEAARLLVSLNLSLTYLKLDSPSRALTWGEKALLIDSKSAKALYRCGQACLELRDYDMARDFLVKAQRLEPFNLEINSELKKLASCYQEYMENQREMCFRMFSRLSTKTTQH
ncbi:inactive peptidyl-prolyl cis-trans isomerase FKBP6 [Discoglossus pictus]